MTMRTCWQLLQSIAKEAAAAQGAGATAAAMVKGAQKYLEQGHTSYMQRAIQADRAQVWPLLWHFSLALMRCQCRADVDFVIACAANLMMSRASETL